MHTQRSPGTPNPNKSIMACHFLRALARINSATPFSSSTQRCRSITRAAYASMAYAAGPRRAWSQALLRRLRCQARLRSRRRRRATVHRRIRMLRSQPRERSQTDVLRSLVPGGNTMDLCSLLEETAHYVQCLRTQVRLMQAMADSRSA